MSTRSWARALVALAVVATMLVGGLTGGFGPASARGTVPERHWAAFQMPSRNIACLFNSGQLRCDILSGLRPEPRKPCAFFWKGVLLPAEGRASFLCIIDTVYDPDAHVLRYGTRWKRDGIVCRSRRTGLRCHNQDLHGFLLSRRLSEKW